MVTVPREDCEWESVVVERDWLWCDNGDSLFVCSCALFNSTVLLSLSLTLFGIIL